MFTRLSEGFTVNFINLDKNLTVVSICKSIPCEEKQISNIALACYPLAIPLSFFIVILKNVFIRVNFIFRSEFYQGILTLILNNI